ncbi:Wall-associated receptor kinase [Trema orientale]|uniref:non-specific serine/threonine protein kinase n=1 Tax=Trema orientale TaxID=63057 RepID=A0A2P5EZI2_TREOI|nr:Wall-associated receptor kinase [Trema orientale]
MEHLLPLILFPLLSLILITPKQTLAPDTLTCRTTCGSIQVKYPFGTGYGCGSPRFQPYVTCAATDDNRDHDHLVLTTHTGSYPITSIYYATSTLTITPPYMSTCSSMQPSPANFGLDWLGPFQLGPSTFILLSCQPPTSSLTVRASPVCDPDSHLCASLYTCPSVVGLGLPLFPPTNSCCVYSPANLDGKDELNLRELKCSGFASVVSLGDYATDAARWQYGVVLGYNNGVLESNVVETKCKSCEMSDGACGYNTEDRDSSFVCVCKSGLNTTTDCNNGFTQYDRDDFWDSVASLPTWKFWYGVLASMIIFICI